MDGYGQVNGASRNGLNVRIMQTDDVVVAEAEVFLDDGFEYYTSRASSRRDPLDSPNAEIGVKLALGRAIRQLGREILKDGQQLVREQERVRRRQEEAAEEAKARKAQRAVNVLETLPCGCVGDYCAYGFDFRSSRA